MNAQQLKNSILQMAVQGKLVSQDPNDEPASVLLERIRAEKEKLIKEGKIKKEKNPSYIFRGEDNLPYEKVGKNEPVCIADEVPFEIPDSWMWTRFGNIVINFDSKRKPVTKSDRKTDRGDYDYYGATGAIDRVDDYIFDGLFLMIGEDGGNFFSERDNSFIAEGKFWANNHVHVVQPICINIWYLKYFLDSCNLANMGLINGIAVPKLNQANLNSILVPVPPIDEQVRIISKISFFTPLLDEYDIRYSALDKLNAQFPEMLKKSILQQAVMGKLVPQDPNDEPASVLLERIRAEKQALIKVGKLKKDKHESIIYRRDNSHYEKLNGVDRCIDDEIPFDIPNSWCWCRLFELCTKITDGSHNPPPKKQAGYRVISAKNIKGGKIVFDDSDRFADQNGFDRENPRTNITRNDLILGIIGGSIGNTAIYMHDDKVIAQRSIAIIKSLISQQYLKLIFDSNYIQSFFISKTSGTAQGGVYLGELSDILIPLPPLEEQRRIVKKVEELLLLCESLNI